MKKRKLFSTAAASLMAVSILAVFPMSAGAAGSYETTLATGSQNTTELKKVLVIEDDANIPAATFTFEASAGDAVAATDVDGDGDYDTLAVLAGVNPTNIKFGAETTADGNGTIVYAANAKADAATDNVTITDDTGKDTYSAVKATTLDFSGCGFTEPGVYRYIITESGTNAGIKNDTNSTRTIDVYVEDATTADAKQLKITGYVMYVGTVAAGPSNASAGTAGTAITAENGTSLTPNGLEVAGAKKSIGFTNTYAPHNLTFGKEVTGNQGSKDKYFKFTVNISGAAAGTVYNVNLSKADSTSGTNAATIEANQNKTNPSTIPVGQDGTASADFYLQDGQYITIQGLSDGTKYEITEVAEDYTSTEGITADNSTFKEKDSDAAYMAMDGAVKNTTDGITADVFTGYTNDRSGTIPTGILLSAAPVIIIGILVIGGIAFLLVRNKRREAEGE